MQPTKQNHDLIRRGLDLLRLGLKPFIQKEMSEVYGDSWETEGRNALGIPSYARLNWDAYALLNLIERKWRDVFNKKLERRNRAWVHEALAVRNDFAHQNASFSDDDTLRDLDTIERLLIAVSAPESREVALLKSAVGDQSPAPLTDARISAAISGPAAEQLDSDEQSEVKKVARRLKLWARRQDQINSRILNAFLKLENSGASVITESDLRNELPDIETFENNFSQMKNFGAQNHGKVFEQDGDVIALWEPVERFVREYEQVRRTRG